MKAVIDHNFYGRYAVMPLWSVTVRAAAGSEEVS